MKIVGKKKSSLFRELLISLLTLVGRGRLEQWVDSAIVEVLRFGALEVHILTYPALRKF